MPASKIQDKAEVLRWFEEDRPYSYMIEQYEQKYHITTTQTMWANFRTRNGIPRRIARNDELIPWFVREEHRWAYPITMLRQEARRREGLPLTDDYAGRLQSWLDILKEEDVVVHYDEETEEGWFYVPREETDTDIIRTPAKRTRVRGTVEE
ncbi:hypothetical protein [Streptomyces sp. NBC_01198]|uniref:hypothetical protein n=1 Tax=Streptomyces sp. NBC_01198 TaxID=2903769 RepID=UPI002E1327B3|nr:hypothetical protein OG702_31960 [Streptomyces sp. NBC_01198]